MQGYRFYEEVKRKHGKRESQGTVIAVEVANGGWFDSERRYCYGAIVGLYPHPNSVVCGSNVSADYLRDECVRISEARAREIHPRLFAWLDTPDEKVSENDA